MLGGQSIILKGLAICCLLLGLGFVGQNQQVSLSAYQFLGFYWTEMPLMFPLLGSLLLGGLAVFFWMSTSLRSGHQQVKQSVRQQEKVSLGLETSQGQVKALEAKIETLERALESALSRQKTSS